MKKILIFFIGLTILISCRQSTSNRLKSVVEDEKKTIGNIEHMEIDSFRYSLGTLLDYYIAVIDFENN